MRVRLRVQYSSEHSRQFLYNSALAEYHPEVILHAWDLMLAAEGGLATKEASDSIAVALHSEVLQLHPKLSWC